MNRRRPTRPHLILLTPMAWSLGTARCHPADTTSGRVDQAVETVFKDPRLQEGLQTSHSGLEALLRNVSIYLLKLWQTIFDWLLDLYLENPLLYYLLLVALSLVALLLIAHIVWTFVIAFRGAPGRETPDDEIDDPHERVRRSQDFRHEAQELAAAGRFREATRALLLALLALIEERHLMRVGPGWTNREILTRLRLRTRGTSELDVFEGTVEKVWYGGLPLSSKDFEKLNHILDRFSDRIGLEKTNQDT